MGELEKILIIINRWGYLNIQQVALLLDKKENITYKIIKKLPAMIIIVPMHKKQDTILFHINIFF